MGCKQSTDDFLRKIGMPSVVLTYEGRDYIEINEVREIYEKGRRDVIDNTKEYIKLKRKYAKNTKDDYIDYAEMFKWLFEQYRL